MIIIRWQRSMKNTSKKAFTGFGYLACCAFLLRFGISQAQSLPEKQSTCCISVAFVFDRSGSLSWGGMAMAGLYHASSTFIDRMNNNCAEAALISFSDSARFDVHMTRDKYLLKQSVNRLIAAGATALWDGALLGIQELRLNAKYPGKGMILFTDGMDNASRVGIDTIVGLAITHGIRIYPVVLGTSNDGKDLFRLASGTGCFIEFVPDPSQLSEIFIRIYDDLCTSFTGLVDDPSPPHFELNQNFPNPFSDRTTIELKIPAEAKISFKVFDVFGREVLDLSREAVDHSPLLIENSQLPRPGAYFYRLTTATHASTKMMTLVK